MFATVRAGERRRLCPSGRCTRVTPLFYFFSVGKTDQKKPTRALKVRRDNLRDDESRILLSKSRSTSKATQYKAHYKWLKMVR